MKEYMWFVFSTSVGLFKEVTQGSKDLSGFVANSELVLLVSTGYFLKHHG